MKIDRARVLLTGAAGGIGQAMAERLRAAGAQVLGVGRQSASGAFANGDWVQADLLDPTGRDAVLAAAAHWQPNVVVQAAGLPGFGRVGTLDATQLQRLLELNLLVPMLLTQALLPQLLAQPRAQLVFVGSALGSIGLPGFSAYGATKAGLLRYAEALRRELADTPVRVQWLAPRATRTGFNNVAVEAYNARTGTASDAPEEVADALLRLIESEAAEHTLGFPERLGVRLNPLLGAAMDGNFAAHRQALNALDALHGSPPSPPVSPALTPRGTP